MNGPPLGFEPISWNEHVVALCASLNRKESQSKEGSQSTHVCGFSRRSRSVIPRLNRLQRRSSNCSGKPLELGTPSEGRKTTKCALRPKPSRRPSHASRLQSMERKKYPRLGDPQPSSRHRARAPLVRRAEGKRFNDCKAYHASGIYSLVPRETARESLLSQ